MCLQTLIVLASLCFTLSICELGLSEKCGRMSVSTGLVQNGHFSTRNHFPFIANIFTNHFGTYLFGGSGSIISEKYIICAANSVAYENYLEDTIYLNPKESYIAYEGAKIRVILGALNYKAMRETDAVIIDGIDRAILHPDLRGTKPRIANIALLKLKEPLNFSSHVQPACLIYDSNQVEDDEKRLFAVGYGVDSSGSISILRKHVPMTLQREEMCRRFFRKAYEKIDSFNFFCAKSLSNSTPCRYDKLLYTKIDDQWYLKAFSSMFKTFKNNTCSLKAPVLYEDLSNYTPWIQQQMLLE
jgi:Trypsin